MVDRAPDPSERSETDGQGRERLLEATRELVFDQFSNGMPLGSVFAHITPAAIAERAGVSRGLIYHHWPGDPDGGLVPMDRLILEVLESVFDRSGDVEELVDSAAALPSEMGAMVRALTDDAVRQMTAPTLGNAWRVRTILHLCGAPVELDVPTPVGGAVEPDDGIDAAADEAGLSDAERETRRWLAEERETAFHRDLDHVHAALLDRFDLRMRDPLTIRDLSVALVAMTDGMGLGVINAGARVTRTRRWRTGVDVADAEAVTSDDWTLYAIAADAIIAGMTEPIPR